MVHRPPLQHAVQFYGDDRVLVAATGAFLIEGLVNSQPAIVIATSAHRDAILDHLTAHFIDVAAARRIGDLVLLDAEETLTTFMVDKMPNPELFRRSMSEVLRQTLRGREHTLVRAYGEMVDVLWKRGLPEAAIRLEVLWNDLASTFTFSLLCGYAIGNFHKQALQYEEVCRQHTHVLHAGTNVVSIHGRTMNQTGRA